MRPYIDLYRRWISMPGVQAADIAVLSALYAHADRDGVCRTTQGELAEELRQSRAWINAVLKGLQAPPVALIAARTRRGYRGFLYELADAVDTSCQPADSGGPGADSLSGTGNPLNPESSFSNAERVEALPVDWTATTDDLAWAAVERPDVDPVAVTGKFVAWCRKAHGRNGYRPADPSAAWRRWILRELVVPTVPPPSTPRRDVRHERRFQRPSTELFVEPSGLGSPGSGRGSDAPGAGLVARNQDTLSALRARLARPA